jgi:CRP/FNR family transcriptional regulator, cyclic AMP receptor protein
MRTKDSRVALLARVPLFAGLSRRELREILALAQEMELFDGRPIVETGAQARHFYLLLEGSAKVTVPGRRARVLGPGDYFGEMTVLDGGPRSAGVVATSHGWALRIDRSAFLRLLDEHGSIGRKILVEMSARVRAAEGARGQH